MADVVPSVDAAAVAAADPQATRNQPQQQQQQQQVERPSTLQFFFKVRVEGSVLPIHLRGSNLVSEFTILSAHSEGENSRPSMRPRVEISVMRVASHTGEGDKRVDYLL